MTVDYNDNIGRLTGIQRLRQIAEKGELPPGAARYYGYSFASIDEGIVVLRFEPGEEHLNLFGTVHGGVLAGLLDTAMGCALISLLEIDEHDTIIDLQTKFVRPVVVDGGPYRIEGNVEHRGRRQSTMSGKIVGANGKLCVTATSTALIL